MKIDVSDGNYGERGMAKALPEDAIARVVPPSVAVEHNGNNPILRLVTAIFSDVKFRRFVEKRMMGQCAQGVLACGWGVIPFAESSL